MNWMGPGQPPDWDFLPKPRKFTEMDNKFVVEAAIPSWVLATRNDLMDTIHHAWLRLYKQANEVLTQLMIGREDYLAVRITPQVLNLPQTFDYVRLKLRLLVDVFWVNTPNVVLPTLVYDEGWDKAELIEWRCGYCQAPNEMMARTCTQCGAPRALLIQEM